MVYDEGGVNMGHTTSVTNKAGLTVVFHEGGLSKEVPVCMIICTSFHNNFMHTFVYNIQHDSTMVSLHMY